MVESKKIFEFKSLGPQGLFFLREIYKVYYERKIKLFGGIVMFKDLSKLEKAGLIIGSIECIVGLGISIWASRQVLKQADEVINKMKEDNEALNNLNYDLDIED